MLEILGLVSLYRLAGVVVAGPIVGTAVVLAARPVRPAPEAALPGTLTPEKIAIGALVAAVALVFGTWILGMWRAYLTGIYSPDSVWYHMPFAARWVQDHATTGIPYTDVDWIDAFYPAGTEI